MSDCKTGAEHIKSLQDGRTVYLDGELVGGVTQHKAFRVARIVDEDTTGITIRGVKILGASSIMANEAFVASIQPLSRTRRRRRARPASCAHRGCRISPQLRISALRPHTGS